MAEQAIANRKKTKGKMAHSSLNTAVKREHLDERLKHVVEQQEELPQHEVSSGLRGIPYNCERGMHVRRIDDYTQKYTFFIYNNHPWAKNENHEFVAKFRKHPHFDQNHNYNLHLEEYLMNDNNKPIGHAEFVAELHYEHDRPLRMAYRNGGPAPKIIRDSTEIYQTLGKHGLTKGMMLNVISNFETDDSRIRKLVKEKETIREKLRAV